jgi:glycosyltransferase involved in cell wall biosynthesis
VNENFKFESRKQQMLEAMNQAKIVFCPSQALAEQLRKASLKPEKVTTVYNGVDKTVFYPGKKRANHLVFVGNMIKTKGVEELYQAFKMLLLKTPKLTLEWVGDGSLRRQIEDQAKQDGISENMVFHGSVSLTDVAAIVRYSELLILPSYREGLPNVLLEAFASGTPVVASAVGGIPEIVNEKTGFLMQSISAEGVAEAVVKAINHQWDYAALEQYSRTFDWRHNAEAVANKLIKAIT